MSSAFNIPDNDAPAPRERNLVITLCGSARFERLFKAWNEALTMAGHTVFGLTAYPSDKAGVKQWYSDEQKLALDAAHFRKIEASDAIFVINRDAYIGSSTMNEIEHARRLGRLVYFLESWGEGNGVFQDALGNDYGLPFPTRSPIDTTTRSGSRDPWAGGLLGPAGALRSSIVELVRAAAAPTPPVDAVPGEPVAPIGWYGEAKFENGFTTDARVREAWEANGRRITPLYATAPSAPAEAKDAVRAEAVTNEIRTKYKEPFAQHQAPQQGEQQ